MPRYIHIPAFTITVTDDAFGDHQPPPVPMPTPTGSIKNRKDHVFLLPLDRATVESYYEFAVDDQDWVKYQAVPQLRPADKIIEDMDDRKFGRVTPP